MRILAFADADSFVKWGAATVDTLPDDVELRFVVVASTAVASQRQIAVAVAGTRVAGAVATMSPAQLRDEYRLWRPDVVVGAARGFVVRMLFEYLVENVPTRPVLVSGLPGISVPVLTGGTQHRAAADVFILHSKREIREYTAYSAARALPANYFLATLPFLEQGVPDVADPPEIDQRLRPDLVFAAQAKVPASRGDRLRLLRGLVAAAVARPDIRVVIKVRAIADERQTHPEADSYDALLDVLRADGEQIPENLVVESGPMAEQLRTAHALVSVSSTALLEAVAAGVPCLVLDDFGVTGSMINTVFEGSGLFGSLADVAAGRFRTPKAEWLDDNYFHTSSEDDWFAAVRGLLERRRTAGLPLYPTLPTTVAGRLRHRFYEVSTFIVSPRGPREHLAVLFWGAVRSANALRKRVLARVRGRERRVPSAPPR